MVLGGEEEAHDATAMEVDEAQAQRNAAAEVNATEEAEVGQMTNAADEAEVNADQVNAGDGGEEEEEAEVEETVENAIKLFDSGCQALKERDFDTATADLCKALEIRVKLHGELAPECAPLYYKYGCSLLYKVQGERDVLSESAQAKEKGIAISEPTETEDATEDGGEEEQNGKEDAEEDIPEEEESDLELAWKMMDIARVIYEKQHTHTLEEVDVICGLADISLEKEDFQTCMDDYNKALEILKGLVDSDHRQLAELYFRMALAKQLANAPKEAREYCLKAVTVCENRLARLNGETNPKEAEIKELESLLIDLKEKADELQQMAAAPSILEVLKAENPHVAETLKQAFQAVANGGKAVATEAASAKDGGVINLGVVGRGIKRATPTPISPDDHGKKPCSEPSSSVAGEQAPKTE